MRKLFLVLILALLMPSDGLTSRDAVVAVYERNEDRFLEAAATGDFQILEAVDGVMEVRVRDSCAEISCGGAGFGSSTHYYGIFFSGQDDLFAVGISCGSADGLSPDGAGYRWREPGGDNEYYVEPLGHHWFYYEAHY